MTNPWEYPAYGTTIATNDGPSRLAIIKRCTNVKKLRAYMAWEGTQKTVRLAAERRIRKLQKGKP